MAVNATSPRLDPCTVTDADPVPALFSRRITLIEPKSTENACDMLPDRSPDVTVTRLVPPDPCPVRHLTDVSESHSVPSHPVCPDRTMVVNATSPRLDPCTVTDTDPVPALFSRRITLIDPKSIEYACDMLPVPIPAVTTMRRVLPIPEPVKHCTDVSDIQSVTSHTVCPNLVCEVNPVVPKSSPDIVTLMLPEDATFDRVTIDIEPSSYENPCETLAIAPFMPTKSLAWSVVPILVVVLQDTDDDEIHVVASQSVCPNVPIWDTVTGPNPNPYRTIDDTKSTGPLGLWVALSSTPLK